MSNPDGCLGRAVDDEPIFVLRANDEIAPLAVRVWALMYRHSKETDGMFNERRREKYQEAQMLALSMERWKKENGCGG